MGAALLARAGMPPRTKGMPPVHPSAKELKLSLVEVEPERTRRDRSRTDRVQLVRPPTGGSDTKSGGSGGSGGRGPMAPLRPGMFAADGSMEGRAAEQPQSILRSGDSLKLGIKRARELAGHRGSTPPPQNGRSAAILRMGPGSRPFTATFATRTF